MINQRENEVATNKLIVTVIYIKILAGLVACFTAYIFERDFTLLYVLKIVFLPSYLFSLIFNLIVKAIGYDKPAVKYLLFTELILSVTLSYLVYANFVLLYIIIPVIIAARSLNRKETLIISICTWISFVFAIELNIYLDKTSAVFEYLHDYQQVVIWDHPSQVFIYYFIPTTFAFIMVVIITDNIILNGKKQLAKVIEQNTKIAVLGSELSMAAQIQQNALPDSFFETEDKKITIKAMEKPAKEVGGDFYDYALIDQNRLAFLVADVSDKGVSAAMFMMAAQKVLGIAIKEIHNLSAAIEAANKLLCKDNKSNMFLTLWVGIIDLTSNTLEYVNCGHQFPVLLKKNKTVKFVDNKPNLILGCFNTAKYKTHTLKIGSGDKLIIYTDGLTDTRNKNDKTLGNEGLINSVNKGITDPQQLIDICDKFRGSAPQFDDITIMEVSVS